MAKILIIDDEKLIRSTLREIFEFESHEVVEAEDGMKALDILTQNSFDVIFCDIKMPKMDGVELLEKIIEKYIVPIVMISGHANIDLAVDCIKKGAFDFIEKPLDLNRILITLRNSLDKAQLQLEAKVSRKKVLSALQIIGQSPLLTQVLDMATKVASTDARVFIMGANGSGKELVARKIHNESLRAAMPFVEVNCAAIPSELIESELFGHEKGSFTSAIKQRKGFFEQAQGGTLFLDEIGDMSLSAQAKVLRALQENKIQRVGGEKSLNVDVRLICATNKNIKKEIEEGRFREDLFHRLGVIVLKVPSLVDRKEDIPLLVDFFLQEFSQKQGKPMVSIDKEAIEALQTYDYPGNIRELKNVIERLFILCDKKISLADVQKYAL